MVLEVIQQSPRSGDHDLDPLPECHLLGSHTYAAVDCGGFEPGVLGQPVEVVPDLEGQLPGGSQDQRAGRAPGPVHQLVKDG